MWHQTNVTERLKIRYPIIQAGMAGATTPELVSEVSNSGGLGTLGAGYMAPDVIRRNIGRIRELTDRPFGINLFVPGTLESDPNKIRESNRLLRPIREKLHLNDPPLLGTSTSDVFSEQLAVVLEARVPVCGFTFGIPDKEVMHQLKKKGILAVGTATTVEEAVLNQRAGMDMVVAQGSEAGGHRGTFAAPFETGMIGTMALIPQVADSVHIPVVAAGGIMDGRGVLAALVLGAGAVQMGTAFLTCDESGANYFHKKRILEAAETDTALTAAFSGKPARGIRNAFIQYMNTYESGLPNYPIQDTLTRDIRREAVRQCHPEWLSMWCGQGVRLSRRFSVSELMKQIVSEIERISL